MPESILLDQFADPEIDAIFGDARYLALLLSVEDALARAQAGLGLIPLAAADKIEQAAHSLQIDHARLRADRSGRGTIRRFGRLRVESDHTEAQNGQTYATHIRWFPPYHFFLMPLFLVNFVAAGWALPRHAPR